MRIFRINMIVSAWSVLLELLSCLSMVHSHLGSTGHTHTTTTTTTTTTTSRQTRGFLRQEDHASMRRYLAISEDSFRIVLEGHVEPRFLCPTCSEALRAEQDTLWALIQAECPSAQLVRTNDKIVNSLTVQIQNTCVINDASSSSSSSTDRRSSTGTGGTTTTMRHLFAHDPALQRAESFLQRLRPNPHVARVYLSANWEPTKLGETVEYLGGFLTTQDFCLKGTGVRVAILDTGLDYTHEALSGTGTMQAYMDAYGTSRTDPANTQRGNFFPTARVVDGYDFLGDISRGESSDAAEDDDPIDGPFGHGTGVAHALLGVAEQAELVGLKVCYTAPGSCPDFAILSAIEYALDPNQDGDTSDHVDIINLSLGAPYENPYYSPVAKAIEDAFALGVLTVVSAGNSGNRPGIIYQPASTPNALAVGATGVAESPFEGGMAEYSCRGPAASMSIAVKPDIVAPGGPFDLAAAGTGFLYHEKIQGTSYSAPLVAGAAALIKQRCPECTPFSIKCILMNNARRSIRYLTVDPNKFAPISWAGAGELFISKAITADVWAYNLGDAQPGVSLGVVNVARDMVVTKTIRVQLLDASGPGSLGLRGYFQFRDSDKGDLGAVKVSFFPETFSLNRGQCGSTQDVIVTISIQAEKVPSNHMTSGGESGIDPVAALDPNEFDGWIIFATTSEANEKDVGLPLYSILRKAAEVSIENAEFPESVQQDEETVLQVGLENTGAGVAQIDTFELLHTSAHESESGFGTSIMPADFRYIGYRTVAVNSDNCDYVVEFVFNAWETIATTVNTFFEAHFDLDEDGIDDLYLSNRGPQQHETNYTECRIFDVDAQVWSCAGLAPDHSGYSSNVVIRGCSNDLGLDPVTTTSFSVRFFARSFNRVFSTTETTGFILVAFPNPALSGPSFDVNPGARWADIAVTGTGTQPNGEQSKGLLLITNGYRNAFSTGASTRETEAIAVTRQGIDTFSEVTGSRLEYPKARNTNGPTCASWTADVSTRCNPFTNPAVDSVIDFGELFGKPDQPINRGPPLNGETCFENSTPRLALSTRFPTDIPTFSPTARPTSQPTRTPTKSPSARPTGEIVAPSPLPPSPNPPSGLTQPPAPSDPSVDLIDRGNINDVLNQSGSRTWCDWISATLYTCLFVCWII